MSAQIRSHLNELKTLVLQDYSLHWQHRDGALVQRWDTAPHHPEIANFPSHTHRATGEVEPAATLNWNGFLTLLQRDILEKDVVDSTAP